MKLDILYEDEQYIMVNKPSGILSIPDRHDEVLPSVVTLLRRQFDNIFIVHRLDKDTSGCICFAKDEITHKYTSQLFENRQVEKLYEGIVHGTILEKQGVLEYALMEHPVIKGKMMVHQKHGKPCKTEFMVLETFGLYSYVRWNLLTGRMHQIRVHMQHFGYPIVCDPLYGKMEPVYISTFKKKYNLSKSEEEEKPILSRLALHASQLTFTSSLGKVIQVKAPLPKDMSAMLNQCRKWLK